MKTCIGNTVWRVLVCAAVAVSLLDAGVLWGFHTWGREASSWKNLLLTPRPDTCALCGDGRSYHAPCLLNMATGEQGELRVYAPSLTQEGEIGETQQTGTMQFCRCAGSVGIIDGDAQTCTLDIPMSNAKMEPVHFCRDCRAALAKCGGRGYVLLERYRGETAKAYRILDGESYSIRDYTVAVHRKPNQDKYQITVTGHYFEN